MAEINPSKHRGSGRRKKHGGKKEAAMGRHSLPIPLGALGIARNLIQVEVSVLHPQIHFKTIPVSSSTTVYEVICILVEKHAIEMKDQNPGSFFLRECVENSQGSYTQVVGDKEQVLEIQHKWKEGNIGYFKLCRRAEKGNSNDEEASGVSPPLHATVLSPAELGEQSDTSSRGEESPLPMSPTYTGTRSTGSTSSPLHQMIRDSAAEGLSGVMSKVVNEVDQSTERRGKSRSGTPPTWWERSGQSSSDPTIALPNSPADLCRESPLLLRHGKGVAVVQPLEYSPSVSAKREFPEFIFAGGDSPEKQRNFSDHVKERRRPYSDGCRPVSQESISSGTSSKKSLPIDSSETRTVHLRQLSPVKQVEVQDTPSLASEMNLLDSLVKLIDRPYIVGNVSLEPEDDREEQELQHRNEKAEKQHAEEKETEKQSADKEPGNQLADEVTKQQADLISPARKKKLLDEASMQLKEKRSSQDSSSSSQTETSPTMPSLISSARKERLLNNACDIVRKKQSKTKSPSPEHTAVQKSTR